MARKQGRVWAFFVAGMVTLNASAVHAEEFIVRLKTDANEFKSTLFQFRSEKSLQILDAHETGQLLKIDLNSKNKQSLAKQLVDLMNDPRVDYVVPNIKMHAFESKGYDYTPNDPMYAQQWSHQRVNSEAAWEVSHGSHNVVVSVIDTGVDYNHPDLKENIWTNPGEVAGNGIDDDGNGFIDDVHGWDFNGNDNQPMDETSDKNPGHGTHCAGIVGAVGNNGVGISGMSQIVSIMPVRFLGADGSGDLMAGAKAIDYAVNNGANIISASWGAAVPASSAQPIIDAIGRAQQNGVVFVAAAANDGQNNDARPVFPANAEFDNMISVAASQSDDTKPSWSNFGHAMVHLASPGHEILSTLPNAAYGKLSGTSMATPKVAGLTALLMAAYGGGTLDGMTLRAIMQTTGAAVGIETACDCRIDAASAINAITSNKMTVVPAALSLAPSATANFSAFGAVPPLRFKSSDQSIATIDANGLLTASAIGETTVIVTDANNQTAKSLKIRIAEKQEQEICPLGDESLCLLMCMIQPDLPWCAR